MKTNATVSTTLILAGLIGAQLVALAVVGLFAFEVYTDWHDDSVEIYYQYSTRWLNGDIPYGDFAMEYPPLALLAFSLPHLLAAGQDLTLQEYTRFFLLENILISLVLALIMLRVAQAWKPGPRQKVKSMALLTVALVIGAPILAWRFDLFPALLTLLGLYLLIANKPTAAGFSLGVAVGVKLYPLVILPVMGIYWLAKRDWASLRRFIFGGALSLIAIAPFYFLSPESFFSFLSYHQQRGLEVESLSSGLILLGKTMGFGSAQIVHNYSAFHLASPYAEIALRWLPYITLASFAILLASCYAHFKKVSAPQGPIPIDSLLAYTVIALLAFIATNKVFSPQYLIWVLPFLPLLRLRYASLLLVIFSLTTMLFPAGFESLLEMQSHGVLLLNLRNGLLVALILWMLVDYTPLPPRLKLNKLLPLRR